MKRQVHQNWHSFCPSLYILHQTSPVLPLISDHRPIPAWYIDVTVAYLLLAFSNFLTLYINLSDSITHFDNNLDLHLPIFKLG